MWVGGRDDLGRGRGLDGLGAASVSSIGPVPNQRLAGHVAIHEIVPPP
ncbi:hypothetical protein ACFQV8_20140 [Pseudonocardia benzenivorans]